MSREEIIAIIKNKPHLDEYEALFTTNIFGQVIQRANKDVVIDDNGFDFMIVERLNTNEESFIDSILPANSNFSKIINSNFKNDNYTWADDAIALHKATFFNEPMSVNTTNENLGDSIFSNEQDNGTNSKLGNWFKPIQDKIDGEKKKLDIKYLSSTIDENNINLVFNVTAFLLKTNKAKIYVQEVNATDEEAVPLTNVIISPNGTIEIVVSFDRKKKFNNFFWQVGLMFQATISCDGFSVSTKEFKLKFEKEKEKKSEKCLCKKKSWTADDLRYIVTQLRKMDDIKIQREFDAKGNPYFVDENGKKVLSNDRGKAPKDGYDFYYKKTSFYDRNDDVDKKPLKDRIFFYDSDETDDNINYNLESQYANYETFSKYLNLTFENCKITKCIQKIHFLAQIYLETNRFRTTFEDTSNTGYSGGNYYQGRGMKQITHDYNYLDYYDKRKGKGKNLFKLYLANREAYKNKKGKIISYESVVNFKKRTNNDFISDADIENFNEFVLLLSTSIYWAFDSAAWYWDKTKLNDFATDKENAIIVVSAKVNNPSASDSPSGKGINGLTERKMYFELLKEIFDYENCK